MELSDERIDELAQGVWMYYNGPTLTTAFSISPQEAIRTAVAEALAPWKAWERAWIFGGDAEWPGEAGTADPRQTVKELEGLVGEAVAAEREACAVAAEELFDPRSWAFGKYQPESIGREVAAAIRARGEEQ